MNTTWYESHRGACEPYLAKHLSLEAAWRQCQDASWLMWLVSELPTLSIRCRWVAAELARQFALLALDSAGIAGEAVEALRACTPIVDEATARVVMKVATAAVELVLDVDLLSTSHAVHATLWDAVSAAAFLTTGTPNYAASSSESAASNAVGAGVSNRVIAALVREAIPWAWVRDAASVDAPELLEVASP